MCTERFLQCSCLVSTPSTRCITRLAAQARACAAEIEQYIAAQNLHTTGYSMGKVRLHLRQFTAAPGGY